MQFLVYLHNHRLHYYLQLADGNIIHIRNGHHTVEGCLHEIQKIQHCNSTTPILNLRTGKPLLGNETLESFR